MTQQSKPLYEFGPYRIDPAKRVLLRGREPVRLPSKVFETLLVLVRHSDEVVSKDDLLKIVWPDSFVEESNLSQSIFLLRKALGETAHDHRYIVTVPGRGYLFAETVNEVRELEGHLDRLYPGRAAARLGGSVQASDQKAEKLRLIVLPFENLDGNPEHEYFSDGLTEEMITQIGRLHPDRLGVIARSTTMRYKNVGKSIKNIGRELGVHYILEGGVRRAADRVRVSVRLIQVTDETNLWAETYERSPADVLQLQSEIARATASEIRLTLTREQQVHLGGAVPVNPEAHDSYLKGRYCWNRRTEEGLMKAIVYFNQAISRDPEFAAAYCGLADAYNMLGTYGALSPNDAFLPAKAAAGRALEIDDTLAETHTSLAWAHFVFDWNWPAAEQEFDRAIELNPNYPNAHFWRGVYLTAMGRISEALVEMHRAQELDPLSLPVVAIGGWIFCFARQYDQAIEQSQKALIMDPNYALAHLYLGLALEQKGMLKQAIAEFRKGFTLSGGGPLYLAYLGHAYAVADEKHKAEEVLHELKNLSKRKYVSACEMALLYAGLRDKRAAFASLQKAYDERARLPLFLKMDPAFDSLRSDPRLQNLLRRMNFPE
jgi:TolB-like protein/Flp pilus assembly protein TadD